jgi:hypothetical protein
MWGGWMVGRPPTIVEVPSPVGAYTYDTVCVVNERIPAHTTLCYVDRQTDTRADGRTYS